jgi:peptidoglycan-associated lipoprotein
MSKTVKAFLCGTAVIALSLLSVACPSKKQKPVVAPSTQAVDTGVPPVPTITNTTAPPTETVATRTDFVTEKPIKEEVLPREIEQLNQYAQQKGYIQDAFYNFDEATLSPEAQAALTASANWLKGHSDLNLLIEGHCDERGTEQYNLALGDRRANSARDFLATLGVEANRMRTVSYGEERPFDQGHDDSAWARNRRAHLVLVK